MEQKKKETKPFKKTDHFGRPIDIGDIVVFCMSRGAKVTRGRIRVGRITRFGSGTALVRPIEIAHRQTPANGSGYKLMDEDVSVGLSDRDDQIFKLEQAAAVALPRAVFEILDSLAITGNIGHYSHSQAADYAAYRIFDTTRGVLNKRSRAQVGAGPDGYSTKNSDLLNRWHGDTYDFNDSNGHAHKTPFEDGLITALRLDHPTGVPRAKFQRSILKMIDTAPWIDAVPEDFKETFKFITSWLDEHVK